MEVDQYGNLLLRSFVDEKFKYYKSGKTNKDYKNEQLKFNSNYQMKNKIK